MEKALIVGVGNNKEELLESLMELENLANANEIAIVKTLYQTHSSTSSFTYVGKGKLEEIDEYLKENDEIVYLIANDELTASQMRNITNKLDESIEITIMDRTTLILAIFKERAKTRAAQVQVEIAYLQHKLAHLVFSEANYDQQRGDSSLANRGSGEKEIDLNRRTLKNKINDLKNELKTLDISRFQQRRLRDKSGKPIVALVGYTNSGKSTIMNQLINEDDNKKVFEKDMLFATLDTSVRKVNLLNNREILLADTIGFIDRLPHQLVSSFHSTLEEALDADLIVHVVDYSNKNYLSHLKITNETLKKIGIKETTKLIYIYNKSDKVSDFTRERYDNSLVISAKNGEDIIKLKQFIYDSLFADNKVYELLIPYANYSDVDRLIKNTNIIEIDNREDGVFIKVELSELEYNYYNKYQIGVN